MKSSLGREVPSRIVTRLCGKIESPPRSGGPIVNLKSWQPFACFLAYLKGKVSREFELQAVRRAFEAGSSALIVYDVEIAVRTIDVAQLHINE